MAEMHEIASVLDALLAKTDVSKVTASGTGFAELHDGYYLCELLDKTCLTATKKDGTPMATLAFKVVEDGLETTISDMGDASYTTAKGTKGFTIYKNYVLSDENSVKRFVSDMLKFELPDTPGAPILSEEYFKTTEMLVEALECLVSSRIYINVQTTKKEDGTTRINYNLVKWDRVEKLGLPA